MFLDEFFFFSNWMKVYLTFRGCYRGVYFFDKKKGVLRFSFFLEGFRMFF